MSLLGDDGNNYLIRFSPEVLEPYGLEFQSRVRTPLGTGNVIGICGAQLYVILDANSCSGVVSGIPLDRVANEVSLELEDVFDHGMHRVKTVVHRGRCVRIVMQSSEGPCPVLALFNALALQGLLDISCIDSDFVSVGHLRATLAAYLATKPPPPAFDEGAAVERTPAVIDPDAPAPEPQLTLAGLVKSSSHLKDVRHRFLGDVEAVLKRLYDGMNLDPIFDGPESFVGDGAVSLFALGGVRLLHGWVVAPGTLYEPLRQLSFNELVMIASLSPVSSPPPSVLTRGQVSANEGPAAAASCRVLAESFYTETMATQMTVVGLAALHASVTEGEVVVLFWRNHFFTATKLMGRLLVLCSDESFTDKSSIVFSVIRNASLEDGFVDGDGLDVDPVIAHIQAIRGGEFSEHAIMEAKVRLQKEALDCGAEMEALTIDPQAVLTRLVNKKGEKGTRPSGPAAAPQGARSSGSSSTPGISQQRPISPSISATSHHACDVELLVAQFQEVMPESTEVTARQFILRYNGSLERAIDGYCQSLSS